MRRRIVQVANFVAPHSGGIRTTLGQLAAGYAAAGHDVVQVLPGERAAEEQTPWGRRITLPGTPLPGTGYRLLLPHQVSAAVGRLDPDRLEVHDRATLRGLGRWARRRGLPAAVVSHERLDRLLRQWLPEPVPVQRLADRSNTALAGGFDTVVCTTGWAAAEFLGVGAANLRQVPLGVDLARFTPAAADTRLRSRLTPGGETLLVMASRLSREKRPELAIAATAELARRGVPVRLAVAGDGPLRARLQAGAAGLPVSFLGFLHGPGSVAALLASADVVLAPGPVETFGLAALEALACGTPVVVNAASALPEVLGAPAGPGSAPAGLAAPGTPAGFADAVQQLLDRPAAMRAAAARGRAEQFPWSATVRGFLGAHRVGEAVAA